MYHRVLDTENGHVAFQQPGITVSKKSFTAQMEFLKANFETLSMSQLADALERGLPCEQKAVLVTFDDGWKDNFTNAYPVLKRLGIPSAIFLTTGFIDTNRRFWQSRLIDLLKASREHLGKDVGYRRELVGRKEAKEVLPILMSRDENGFNESISVLMTNRKKRGAKDIEEWLGALRTALGIDSEDVGRTPEFLSWEEVRTMSKDAVEFGSHGVTHQILPQKKEIATSEIADSKKTIEDKLRVEVKAFSYPNGEYDEEILRVVKKGGYAIAFGTEPGPILSGSHQFALPRVNIHEDMTSSIPMFLGRIAGLW